MCEDSLREILPSCPHRHISRTKRQSQGEEYEYNKWCRDHRCAFKTVTCASGCPMEMIAYDCNRGGSGMDGNGRNGYTYAYTIVCEGVTNINVSN